MGKHETSDGQNQQSKNQTSEKKQDDVACTGCGGEDGVGLVQRVHSDFEKSRVVAKAIDGVVDVFRLQLSDLR